MRKFFQSRGFIATLPAVLCVAILGVYWFAGRNRTENFRPEESPPSSTTSGWSGSGTQADGEGGARTCAPGQSSSPEEEYPKMTSETEDKTMTDFTDMEKPETTPPPAPEGKTGREDPSEDHPVNPGPEVPEITTPPTEKEPASNEPALGASNDNGAVHDPVSGWIVPGNGQEIIGGSDGDINKQIGNMG